MLPYTERARNFNTKEYPEWSRSATYDLMSVVVHVGEIDTGHYVSYCRVGDQVRVQLCPGVVWDTDSTCSGSRSMITRWSWLRNPRCSAPRHISSFTSSGRWARKRLRMGGCVLWGTRVRAVLTERLRPGCGKPSRPASDEASPSSSGESGSTDDGPGDSEYPKAKHDWSWSGVWELYKMVPATQVETEGGRK